METIEQNNKRRNNNYHTLSELEGAGNIIIRFDLHTKSLLMQRGDTITEYSFKKINNLECYKPINAYH